MTELGDQAPRRPHRQKKQPQQRGLASAGRPGEELKRMRVDTEREVAQDLGPKPIAQAHILESDHPPLSDKFSFVPPLESPSGRALPRQYNGVLSGVLWASLALPPVRNCAFYRIMAGPPEQPGRKSPNCPTDRGLAW